jgi:hypothetical protein
VEVLRKRLYITGFLHKFTLYRNKTLNARLGSPLMHIKLWKIQMSSLLKGKQLQQQHQTFDQKKTHQLFLIVAPSNIHVEPRKRKASKPIEKARHIHFQTFFSHRSFPFKK